MKAPSRFLEDVVALARLAGEKILDIYHSDFRVGQREDDSPLTAADLASHHCLTEGLQNLPGAYPVLSEESAPPPFEERREWETYWLIDPLDGVGEFIDRQGGFTLNIALIHQHKPVLGLVYAPALETCYFAAEGCGAFKKVGQRIPEEIHVRMSSPQTPLVLGSRSSHPEKLDAYLDHLGAHDWQCQGGSLKFCLIAEGKADLYPCFDPSSEWDTAAAQCIVEAAGGSVIDLLGKALRYNANPSLLNPHFLAFGDKTRDWGPPAE
ncbi:MAG: 3'(2'),5'-bisphosphate nucleotidase CysQ, partial [Methylococcaceae bacterium]|nr:3'(2'),5'-bisphosphate nucleotidase CysQ [Methylococcaceae bacterium]